MQRRFGSVEPVQVINTFLHPGMNSVLQDFPFKLAVVVPLRLLSEFTAHKHEFFPRESEHERVEGSQIGELLPFVSRHL